MAATSRDDPYNRQPYPWADATGYDELPTWRQQDTDLLAHYQFLGQLRGAHSFLRTGSWETFVTDDAGVYAFGRKDETGAAVIVINRSDSEQTLNLDVTGFVPFGSVLVDAQDPSFTVTVPITMPGPVSLPAMHELRHLADGGGHGISPPRLRLSFWAWTRGTDRLRSV